MDLLCYILPIYNLVLYINKLTLHCLAYRVDTKSQCQNYEQNTNLWISSGQFTVPERPLTFTSEDTMSFFVTCLIVTH